MMKQKNKTRDIKKTLIYTIVFLCVSIMFFLSYYSVRYSIFQQDVPYGVTMRETKDSLLLNFIVGGIFLVAMSVAKHLFKHVKNAEKWIRNYIYVIMGITFVFCLLWVLNGNFYAQNDSRCVLESMERMKCGDYSDLLPAGYIGAYKHQLGLITLFGMIFTVTGTTNNLVIQIVNSFCVPIIIYAGYRILKEMYVEIFVYVYYGIFMLFCFPLFFYTPYVYGEIISITSGMVFIGASLSFFKNRKISVWVILIICSVIGYLARANFLILLIAFDGVALLYSIKERCIVCFGSAASIFMVVMLVNILNVKYYEEFSGIQINQGIPIVGWIAMGLDENGELANGMYNGFTVQEYSNSGYDTEVASVEFIKYINDRLTMFRNGAGTSAIDFYKEKLVAQWNDPTYNCFMENKTFVPRANPVIENIVSVDGRYAGIIREILNQYHWILYLGVLCYCLLAVRVEKPFYHILIIIIIIGGFLFTVIWEAMSRYVLPYAIYMIPLSACGWFNVIEKLSYLCRGVAVKYIAKRY